LLAESKSPIAGRLAIAVLRLDDVQSRDDVVSGSWSTIASNLLGTDGVVTNIDTDVATVPKRF
jgi:hypothetical protein